MSKKRIIKPITKEQNARAINAFQSQLWNSTQCSRQERLLTTVRSKALIEETKQEDEDIEPQPDNIDNNIIYDYDWGNLGNDGDSHDDVGSDEDTPPIKKRKFYHGIPQRNLDAEDTHGIYFQNQTAMARDDAHFQNHLNHEQQDNSNLIPTASEMEAPQVGFEPRIEIEDWNFDKVCLDENASLQMLKDAFEYCEAIKNPPSDAKKPFVIGLDDHENPENSDSDKAMTEHLAMELTRVQARNQITNKAMLDLLTTFQKYAPGLMRLPVKKLENSMNYKLTMKDYMGEDCRKFKVHVCPSGCTAYIGKWSKCIKCHCGLFRLKPCSHSGHNLVSHDPQEVSKSRQECDPNRGGHSMLSRTPERSFYYRGIIALIKLLVTKSIETNSDLYNYHRIRRRPKDKNGRPYILDILDGSQGLKHQNEMDDRGDAMSRHLNNPELIQISWLLSEFYDGALLHKRRSKSVWVLAISLLNANPSKRMEHGAGYFAVAYHDLKLGSVAEQAIFNQLLVPELQLLGSGILFEPTIKGVKRQIFIQARLILHVLDTKALEHVARIKGKFLSLLFV